MYQFLAVLFEVSFERAFEIGGVDPRHVVFLAEDVVIGLRFLHINRHIGGDVDKAIASHTVLLIVVVVEDVVDVLVFNEGVGQVVFVADGQGQFVVDGMYEDGVSQDVPVEGQQEGEAAAVDTLEEGAFAETHHTQSGSGEVFQQLLVGSRGIGCGIGVFIF